MSSMENQFGSMTEWGVPQYRSNAGWPLYTARANVPGAQMPNVPPTAPYLSDGMQPQENWSSSWWTNSTPKPPMFSANYLGAGNGSWDVSAPSDGDLYRMIGIRPETLSGAGASPLSNRELANSAGFGNLYGADKSGGSGSIFDNFLSTRDQQGWGSLALSGAMGLANTFLGMKQYSLAKDSLAASKEQFERNFDAQRKLTNSRLEDRQRARLSYSPNSFESLGTYMDKYGVK